jgi:uncharacterized membrane protein (UPF0136 family)
MGGSAHASFAVGGIVISGGLYAYIAKKSLKSLYGSLLLGGGLLYGGYLVLNGKDLEGHSFSAAASTGVVAVGARRLLQTQKAMPAVPLLIIGLISSAYQIKKVVDWQ